VGSGNYSVVVGDESKDISTTKMNKHLEPDMPRTLTDVGLPKLLYLILFEGDI
jgi:hypothetical protein